MDTESDTPISYRLADERADLEALAEILKSVQQRWENRLSREAAKKLWQHQRFDVNPWAALTAAYPEEVAISAAASLRAALTEIRNAIDFLADPPTAKPNLKLSRSRSDPHAPVPHGYRDAGACEQADLLR